MGDRVAVDIVVEKKDEKAAFEILKGRASWDSEFVIADGTEVVLFFAEDVNYGNMDEEEEALQDAGVSYDLMWSRGHEFSSGTHCYRHSNDPDKVAFKEIIDSEIGYVALNRVKESQEKGTMEELLKAVEEEQTYLSWK